MAGLPADRSIRFSRPTPDAGRDGFLGRQPPLLAPLGHSLDGVRGSRRLDLLSGLAGAGLPARQVFRTFRGLRGVSDILGVFPQTVRLAGGETVTFGNILCIEVKRPGQKPRPDQAAFLEEVRALGGIALCVHSLAELEAQLRPFPGAVTLTIRCALFCNSCASLPYHIGI